MIDWNPDDLLYAPLRLADGRIVAVVSVDDPVDGRRPTPESLAPLELFLYQAAVAIENARLIKQLNDAKTQMQEYAGQLEIKVKERTRELVDTQYRLLKSERLAAIGELAGMVGHDLRNPLTGIAGAAYYLRTRLSSKISKKARDMLKLIEEDIGHSNKIINDLLEYSKEIRLDLTDTNPKTLLKETLASIKIPKRIHVTDRTQTSPRIRVDAQRMRRVFTNIIRNAFDAMPDNGTVTIRSKKTADGVVFIFSDTGAGMSRETVEKLWTPLFTTKAKGMGFGLPICKRVVEGHGGNISASSEPGKGSTFTIALPIEPKTQEESCRVFMVPLEPSPRVIDGAKTLE
jgi:signal transduction histidine kinase